MPWTAIALVGTSLTAAQLLRAIQRLLTKEAGPASTAFGGDVRVSEFVAVAPLLLRATLLGALSRPLLDVIELASRAVVALVGR